MDKNDHVKVIMVKTRKEIRRLEVSIREMIREFETETTLTISKIDLASPPHVGHVGIWDIKIKAML